MYSTTPSSQEKALMNAGEVFRQNDGEVTKSYYAELGSKGNIGQLAVALFRAQKRSTAAKKYKRGKFRHSAYDVKNWSLTEICRILLENDFGFRWGWKTDPNTPEYNWVLYCDLPNGQVSFHSANPYKGPKYEGEWDGCRGACESRILAFCDQVMTSAAVLQTLE
jgi:hypothetical protein